MAARTHTCPGLCGSKVPDRLFACRACWYRLPRDLQAPILATARLPIVNPSRWDAVQDAMQWYGEQATPVVS